MRIGAVVLAAAIMVVLLPCRPAGAQDEEEFLFSDLSLGPKIGTLGIGGEVTSNIMTGLNLRGSYQWLQWSDLDLEIMNISYQTDVSLSNPMVLLDWYPSKGVFRLSAGLLLNLSELTLDATNPGTLVIGDSPYSRTQVTGLHGETEFKQFVPYIGIGWGNTLSKDGHLSFSADIGVAFAGVPNVTLTATGPSANSILLKPDLALEETYIEDYFKILRYYPVVSLALCYRF